MQQLAEAAPALVVASEAVEGLGLHRELLKADPGYQAKVADAIATGLAARGLRPPRDRGRAAPQQIEAARIDDFRRLHSPFAEAFASLSLELAGLLRPDGVVLDSERGPSACAVLARRATAIAMVLDAGQVPERAEAGAFRDWGELGTLVECEVAALARSAVQAAGEVGAGLNPLTPQRQAEQLAQLEASALPLLQLTQSAYERGWREEALADNDLEQLRVLLRPFARAADELASVLRRRGVERVMLGGWGGDSGCQILSMLASSVERCMEWGELPRDRRYLVGEGMSKMLVPAWWDRLRQHVRHEIDLLAGRASELPVESVVPPRKRSRTDSTALQEEAARLTERLLVELPGSNEKPCRSVQDIRRRLRRHFERKENRADRDLEELAARSRTTIDRYLKDLQSEGRIDDKWRRLSTSR